MPGLAEALRKQTWTSARTDVTVCGGITPARKALALVEAAEINCEIMSWGVTLVSAANLQLMLAFPNCTYYEQAVPYKAYEYGMKNVIRTQPDGTVQAPEGPGLGVEVDWEAMEEATLRRFSSHG